MTTTQFSLTKTLALAAVSHLEIASTSLAADAEVLSASGTTTVASLESTSPSASNLSIPEELQAGKPLTANQKIKQVGDEVTTQASKLDTAIKYGIVTAGIAAGAAATYFYGSALAATAAYETSLALANWMMPNQSLMTYYLVTHPAAINAGMQFANSSLVQGTLGMTSSLLGYGLGKAGCGLYDGAKYIASAAGSAAYSTASYLAKHGYDIAANAGSATVETTRSVTSSVATAASTAASTLKSTVSSAISSGWNWLSNKAASATISLSGL